MFNFHMFCADVSLGNSFLQTVEKLQPIVEWIKWLVRDVGIILFVWGIGQLIINSREDVNTDNKVKSIMFVVTAALLMAAPSIVSYILS